LPESRKGLIVVYTGPGKGKTTAALGIGLRAVGQGMRVLMVQFIKGSWHYGELDAAKMLGQDLFEILPMGRGFVKIGVEKPDPEDVRLVGEGWRYARAQMSSGRYDVLILDEINYAISYKMLDPDEVLDGLRRKPSSFASRHLDRPQCSSRHRRAGGYGYRDARREAPLHSAAGPQPKPDSRCHVPM
jgi:cob(I)alamin adenosyltransferase